MVAVLKSTISYLRYSCFVTERLEMSWESFVEVAAHAVDVPPRFSLPRPYRSR
jgi:hypothetical protein